MFELKTPLHVLGEHNSMKSELYRSNTTSQGLVSAHFALIIIIVVYVIKHQLVYNCKQSKPPYRVNSDLSLSLINIIHKFWSWTAPRKFEMNKLTSTCKQQGGLDMQVHLHNNDKTV